MGYRAHRRGFRLAVIGGERKLRKVEADADGGVASLQPLQPLPANFNFGFDTSDDEPQPNIHPTRFARSLIIFQEFLTAFDSDQPPLELNLDNPHALNTEDDGPIISIGPGPFSDTDTIIAAASAVNSGTNTIPYYPTLYRPSALSLPNGCDANDNDNTPSASTLYISVQRRRRRRLRRLPLFLPDHGSPLGSKGRALLLHLRHLFPPRFRLWRNKLVRLRRHESQFIHIKGYLAWCVLFTLMPSVGLPVIY